MLPRRVMKAYTVQLVPKLLNEGFMEKAKVRIKELLLLLLLR